MAPARDDRSPVRYFLLVFALSTPLWLLGAVIRRPLSADLPVSSFIWVCPAVAAAVLVWREGGRPGVKRLLRRAVDWRRIRDRRWYLPIVLLQPAVYAATFGVLWLTGSRLPEVRFPLVAGVVQPAGFLVPARTTPQPDGHDRKEMTCPGPSPWNRPRSTCPTRCSPTSAAGWP